MGYLGKKSLLLTRSRVPRISLICSAQRGEYSVFRCEICSKDGNARNALFTAVPRVGEKIVVLLDGVTPGHFVVDMIVHTDLTVHGMASKPSIQLWVNEGRSQI
jgi:hypothetical protein